MSDPNTLVGPKAVAPFLVAGGEEAQPSKGLSEGVDAGLKGLDAADVIPAGITRFLGPVKILMDYLTGVAEALKHIGKLQYEMGYAEGFARYLTYVVLKEEPFASDATRIPFIHESSPGTYKVYKSPEDLPPEDADAAIYRFIAEKGRGFFKGRDKAAESVGESRQLSVEELLNKYYVDFAKSRGYENSEVGGIHYYSADDISRIEKGQKF